MGRPRAFLVALVLAGCDGAPATSGLDDVAGTADHAQARDWSQHPAIVDLDDGDEIFALSDPHGNIDVLKALLLVNGIIDHKDGWAKGGAILVVAGDLIDKSPKSLEVIDFLRSLQADAAGLGGQVIVTMGNHEAEFFVNPLNEKATSDKPNEVGIDVELGVRMIDPTSLAQRRDSKMRGAWLYNLPFGVRIKKWFFSHGGNTDGRSVKKLTSELQSAVDDHGFKDKEITGDNSILELQNWYGDPDKGDAGKDAAKALGVNHMVFGHDPGALHTHGQVEASKNGVLIKLDCAMGLDLGDGVNGGNLLHVNTQGTDTAEALDSSGQPHGLDL
jgi:hypothetical protein